MSDNLAKNADDPALTRENKRPRTGDYVPNISKGQSQQPFAGDLFPLSSASEAPTDPAFDETEGRIRATKESIDTFHKARERQYPNHYPSFPQGHSAPPRPQPKVDPQALVSSKERHELSDLGAILRRMTDSQMSGTDDDTLRELRAKIDSAVLPVPVIKKHEQKDDCIQWPATLEQAISWDSSYEGLDDDILSPSGMNNVLNFIQEKTGALEKHLFTLLVGKFKLRTSIYLMEIRDFKLSEDSEYLEAQEVPSLSTAHFKLLWAVADRYERYKHDDDYRQLMIVLEVFRLQRKYSFIEVATQPPPGSEDDREGSHDSKPWIRLGGTTSERVLLAYLRNDVLNPGDA